MNKYKMTICKDREGRRRPLDSQSSNQRITERQLPLDWIKEGSRRAASHRAKLLSNTKNRIVS